MKWIQISFRAPEPLREKLKYEAWTLMESFNEYMLQLMDLRHESYDKLLTQKELRLQELRQKRAKK